LRHYTLCWNLQEACRSCLAHPDLPERFGKVSAVKQRYDDWIERGAFSDIFQALSGEADMEWLMVDSTIVRAHQHAAGARRQKGGAHVQGLGRSRGGLSTKIHASTDGLGDSVRLLAGPGQESDIGRAVAMIEGFHPGYVLADKGYDADHFRAAIAEARAHPVIPFTRSRAAVSRHDPLLYKERNRVERFLSKLKQFRRVATRYDKLLATFMGFVTLAAIAILLR
jgi:transposase